MTVDSVLITHSIACAELANTIKAALKTSGIGCVLVEDPGEDVFGRGLALDEIGPDFDRACEIVRRHVELHNGRGGR